MKFLESFFVLFLVGFDPTLSYRAFRFRSGSSSSAVRSCRLLTRMHLSNGVAEDRQVNAPTLRTEQLTPKYKLDAAARIIAIGDVHGGFNELHHALK
eukprot:757162-Hanusia_phi.AAC.2